MIAKKPRPQLTVASVSELHRQWLELVDTDGPFLAIPPLKRVWPQGMPSLSDERKDTLDYARKDFEAAWENFDRAGGASRHWIPIESPGTSGWRPFCGMSPDGRSHCPGAKCRGTGAVP